MLLFPSIDRFHCRLLHLLSFFRTLTSVRTSGALLGAVVIGVSGLADQTHAQQESGLTKSTFRRVTTIAGNGKSGDPSEKGRATEVALSNPFGVQPEADGSLIVASFDQHVIYRLDANYRSLELIAGTGKKGLSGRTGDLPTKVAMNQPHEVQVDFDGNIYIADTMNHRVGMISADSGRWVSIAGSGEAGFSGDQGKAPEATINQAYSIIVDANELFIADLKNHRIRRVDLESNTIETICGTGEKGMPKDGALAIEQPLAGPRSLAVDEDNLWIVLREGNSVWRMDRTDGRLYHVAGTGKKGFSGDGKAAKQATFAGPKGITVDPGVAVFIADTENHAIRRIDLASGIVTTVMGKSGKPGFNGDGDQVQDRMLARPHGVCILPNGDLLVGDSENHRLRLLEH